MSVNSYKEVLLHDWDEIRKKVLEGLKRLGHDIVLITEGGQK